VGAERALASEAGEGLLAARSKTPHPTRSRFRTISPPSPARGEGKYESPRVGQAGEGGRGEERGAVAEQLSLSRRIVKEVDWCFEILSMAVGQLATNVRVH